LGSLADKYSHNMVLAIVMGLIFVIGFFLDFIEITFIHVPVLAPIMIEFGFDPAWFCILIAVNLQTSFMTPPFGFSLFYLKAVTPPEISTGHIYRGIIPFVIVQIIGLLHRGPVPPTGHLAAESRFWPIGNRQADFVSITPPLTKEESAMKRRDFLKKAGVGAAAVAATTVNAPAVLAKKTYNWKMVTTWPPKLPVLQDRLRTLAKRIGELSDGRIKIQVFAGGELVPPLESFQAVSDGTVEVGSGASYYWAGKEPATQWFAAVPFGLNGQGMSAWFYGGDGLKLWEETYAPFNLIPRPGGSTGVQMGGWFNKKIESIDDFKGLKMRIPGLGGKVLAKAGGTVVLLPGGEIFTSLERGVIDATEWVGPLHDLRMGFYQAAKYYYYPGWHEPGTYLEYFFNKKAYESLPKDLQHIIDAACTSKPSTGCWPSSRPSTVRPCRP
jgi:TRAP-type mannitol/chloroaromatic compound transport system substrate-binding protein